MLIRYVVVLALLAHASPNVRIFAIDYVSTSDDITSHAPSSVTSAAALVPTHEVDLRATQSTRHRHVSHSTHFPHTNATRTVHRPLPHTADLPSPQQTVQPGDIIHHHTGEPAQNPPSNGRGPHVARVFFEVLGGVVGLLIFLAVLRCVYVYKRTPRGVRAPTPEIGEIDRTLALLRNPWRPIDHPPPPPPYQHAPAYDVAVSSTSDCAPSSEAPGPPIQV